MSSVYQLKSGYWYYQTYVVNPLTGDRERKQYSLGIRTSNPPSPRQREQVEKLQREQDSLWMRKDLTEVGTKDKIGSKILTYLEDRRRKVKNGDLSSKTLETDEMVLGTFSRFMTDHYSDPHIRKITKDHIYSFVDEGKTNGFKSTTGLQGDPVSDGTISLYLRHLKTFFRSLIPEIKKDVFKDIPIKKPRVSPVHLNDLTPLGDEWETLYSKLEEMISEGGCRPPTYLLLSLMKTGCRVRELLNLKWKPTEDYELVEGISRNSWSYLSRDLEKLHIYFKRVRRTVPVVHLKPLLTEMKEKFPSNEIYVFGNPSTGSPYQYSNIRRHLKVVLKSCDLPHYPIHSLRHGFISKWVRESGDIVTIGSIVGHTTTHLTDYYLDVGEKHKIRLSQKF